MLKPAETFHLGRIPSALNTLFSYLRYGIKTALYRRQFFELHAEALNLQPASGLHSHNFVIKCGETSGGTLSPC